MGSTENTNRQKDQDCIKMAEYCPYIAMNLVSVNERAYLVKGSTTPESTRDGLLEKESSC